jgi:hypothetical protein
LVISAISDEMSNASIRYTHDPENELISKMLDSASPRGEIRLGIYSIFLTFCPMKHTKSSL